MSIKIEETGLLKIASDTVLFSEGEKVANLLVFTKGDIDVYISSRDLFGMEDQEEIIKHSCKLFKVPKNIIIGIGGYRDNSNYMFSLKSNIENEVYIVKTSNKDEIKNFFNKNKSYLTNMYHSISYLVLKFYEEYIKIRNINNELKIISTNLGVLYFNLNDKNKNISSQYFLKTKEIFDDATNSGVYIPHSFDADFVKANHNETYMHNKNLSEEDNENKLNVQMDFVRRFLTMPKNLKDGFFTYDTNMSLSAANMMYDNLTNIIGFLKKEFVETIGNMLFMYSHDKNLYLTNIQKRLLNSKKKEKTTKFGQNIQNI